MKTFGFKKILKILLAILVAIFFSCLIFVFVASNPVPEKAEEIIRDVFSKEIPQQILGDTAMAASGELDIWYESINPKGTSKGTILLIMGLGGNAIEWPQYFVQPLVDAGYQVIRFDNRSTGLSSWVDEEFSLEDMALDAFAVMDAAGVQAAHVMGISMGGMVAQLMAIEHPERLQSLISMMASGYTDDPELESISRSKFLALIATGIRHGIFKNEKNIVRTTVSVRSIMVPELSEERIRALAEQSLFNQRFRRGFNPDAFMQQTKAVLSSGSRLEKLKTLKVPTLVIHGREDPLIPMSHGIKTAAVIPNAELVIIDGMGHDVSPEHMKQVHDAIFDFLEGVEKEKGMHEDGVKSATNSSWDSPFFRLEK